MEEMEAEVVKIEDKWKKWREWRLLLGKWRKWGRGKRGEGVLPPITQQLD